MVTSDREPNVNDAASGVTLDISDFVGFGFAELSYLLARYSGEPVERSRKMLMLSSSSSEVTSAGVSSLVARDFIRVNGDDLDLVGPPAVLAHTLSTAVRWTQIGLVGDEQVDGALYVQSRDAAVIMQPRVLGTWFVLVQSPEVSAAEAIFSVISSFIDNSPAGAVFLGSETANGSDAVFVRRLGDDEWNLVVAPDDDDDAGVDGTVTESGLVERLGELLVVEGWPE